MKYEVFQVFTLDFVLTFVDQKKAAYVESTQVVLRDYHHYMEVVREKRTQ